LKILIINIDSKIPNYALKKIEAYHRDRKDEVIWDFPLAKYSVDRIYVSCIFAKNKALCNEYEIMDNAFIGGSGYDLDTNLPDDIESVKPRINLGFTTRGCIRKCGFCVVPRKEGNIRVVGDLLDLWDGLAKKIVLLDNNILAMPEHFRLICKQARDNKIALDFNQGLDHRLIDDGVAKELKSVSHEFYRLAFDHPSYFKNVEKAIDILHAHGLIYNIWYVLVGYDATIEEDLFRLNYLRNRRERVFLQRYRHDPIYVPMAQWANNRSWFSKMTFDYFIRNHSKGVRYKELYRDILKIA